jgi:Bacterial regulatory protein, Fis family
MNTSGKCAATGNHKTQAARMLGIHPTSLLRRLKKLTTEGKLVETPLAGSATVRNLQPNFLASDDAEAICRID